MLNLETEYADRIGTTRWNDTRAATFRGSFASAWPAGYHG